MLKKVPLLLLCPILIQICYACSSCLGEDTYAYPYYDVKGYTSKSSRITGVNKHSKFEFERISEYETVAYDRLAISVQATKDYYAQTRLVGSFYHSAIACDPMPDGYDGTTELLDSLVITSYYDFDSAHPKGTKLNDFFDRYAGAERVSSLNQYLKQDSLQAPGGIGLMLNTKPVISKIHQFKIVFYLSTGEEYAVESVLVRLE